MSVIPKYRYFYAGNTFTTEPETLIMYAERKTGEQEIRLPDKAMAALLGLSLGEYLTLSHRPMETLEDIHGNVMEFYIHISPNNEPHILNRLKIDRNSFVRFKPEEVYSHI